MSTYYKFARTLRHSRRLVLASGAVYAALNVRLVNGRCVLFSVPCTGIHLS